MAPTKDFISNDISRDKIYSLLYQRQYIFDTIFVSAMINVWFGANDGAQPDHICIIKRTWCDEQLTGTSITNIFLFWVTNVRNGPDTNVINIDTNTNVSHTVSSDLACLTQTLRDIPARPSKALASAMWDYGRRCWIRALGKMHNRSFYADYSDISKCLRYAILRRWLIIYESIDFISMYCVSWH